MLFMVAVVVRRGHRFSTQRSIAGRFELARQGTANKWRVRFSSPQLRLANNESASVVVLTMNDCGHDLIKNHIEALADIFRKEP
jgi:hypothetical protein